MILVIDGKTYPRATVDDLSLKQILALQRELIANDISSAKSWDDLSALITEFASQSEETRKRNPEAMFLSMFTIWATRVCAGDDVSLLDVMNAPISELKSVKWVKEPEDELPEGKAQARPKSGTAKRTPKKTSGPAT